MFITRTKAADLGTSAAQTTAAVVRQGVVSIRTWAAPRLDGAADYCTTTVAPTVSSALRATAAKVSPAEAASAQRRKTSALTWPLLVAAGLAAAGAVAAAIRHRYRTSMAADSESPAEPAAAKVEASANGTAPETQETETAQTAPRNDW